MWNKIKNKAKDKTQSKPSSHLREREEQRPSRSKSPAPPPISTALNKARTTNKKNVSGLSAGDGEDHPPTYDDSVNSTPVSPDFNKPDSLVVKGKQKEQENPIGLQVVFEPDFPRKFDIIFVHGLGGTSRFSWSWNKDVKYFWPKEWLPFEPDIKEGRVLSFGYDASIAASPRSFKNVSDFAKDLLFDMKFAKDNVGGDLELGKKPIVFIVHSMGGLVVKEAYILGQNDPDYKNIIQSVSSIIFLSTPHRGTGLAKVLNRILSTAALSRAYVTDLEKNSLALQKINDQFRHVAPNLNIVSFYETRETAIGPKKILILERDSSVLGYPGEVSKSLDADHHGVCKYESKQDPNYIHVRNWLASLVKRIRTGGSSKSSIHEMSEAQAKEVQTIAQLLGNPQRPDDDFNYFRDLWTPKTCEWILRNNQFLDWLDVDSYSGSRILWVTSGPATGKSVLSSFIIDYLTQQQKACQFFFVRFGDQSKRNTGSLLRSLALQIAQKIPDFSRKFVKLADMASRLDKAEARTIWSRIFLDVLFQMTGEPLYWVIDGLDEATSPRALVKLLSDISRSTIPIRVLVVSRKTQELETAFDQTCQNVPVDFMPTSNVDEDIYYFIQEEKDYFHGSAAFREQITAKIIERANGNFLWVYLAAKRIEKCHTKTAVENALEALPSGMQGLYARMAKAIASHEEVTDVALSKAVLTWACFARRPMNLDELTHAFKLDRRMPPAMDLRNSIAEVCGGFIRLDKDSNVVMIHQTAQEFLLNSLDLPFSVIPSEVNGDLFTTCIRCLMDLSLRSKLGQGRALPPFVQYASSSWYYHLDQCIGDTDPCLPLLVRFLKSPSVLTWIQVCAQTAQLGLLVEASRVFGKYVAKCRKEDEDKMPLHRRLAETEILEKWSTDLVKIVGKFGSQLLSYPHSIHKLIPPFCPEKSAIHQQFGKKERNITLKGFSKSNWDDSLARMHVGHNRQAAIVVAAGLYVAILAKSRQSGEIFIYEAKTCKQCRKFNHEERVLLIALNDSGDFLATFGYRTTKIWSLSTGLLLYTIPKPSYAIPMTALFDHEGIKLTAAYNDRTVRQLSLDSDKLLWHTKVVLEETEEIEGTFYNSPTSIALHPNGREALIGYRAFPLTLWDIEAGQPMYRCMHTSSTEGNDEPAWPAVRKVIWRPQSDEVFGIYDSAAVFKWDPVIDSHQLGASGPVFDIACSVEGHYFVTGHVEGSIQIWNATHFAPIYKISSTLLLSGITFSPDSRRIYDIRGSYCNVWEPNVLIRLEEIDGEGASSHAAAEVISENPSADSGYVDSKAGSLSAVTCVASCPTSSIYCAGNEDGYVHLVVPENDTILEVSQGSAIGTSIEVVAWADDGSLMCAADLSGRLRVYAVKSESGPRSNYSVDCTLDMFVNIEGGSIRELVFSSQNDRVLVITLARLTVISIPDSKVIATLAVESSQKISKWTNAPFQEDLILDIYAETVDIYSWLDLTKLTSVLFSETLEHRLALLNIEHDDQSSGSSEPRLTRITSDGVVRPWENSFKVERTLFTPDKSQILVQTSLNSTGLVQNIAFFMVNMASLAHGTSLLVPALSIPNTSSTTIPLYHFLPLNIARRIQVPLGFINNDRLVFLDHNFWLCSAPAVSPNASSSHSLEAPSAFRRKSSGTQSTLATGEITIDGVTQHYCLPGDWRSLEGLKMMSVLRDGTLLCLRNGEVAAVGCAEVRSLART